MLAHSDSGEGGSVGLRDGDPRQVGGYVLTDRLGAGGMGTVFLGHSVSGREVAVKVVHQQLAEDFEFRARFRQEVAAVRRVSGAFTAPVVDADPDAESPWMATLRVPGLNLAEHVERHGTLSGRPLRKLALGLAEALRDIHKAGVVHRDLKPGNVLMGADGPRVIDFGISRAVDSQTLTITGRVIGTPPFMSPEQLRTPRAVTASSDVFSLGAVLVYAATGYGPFDDESPYMTAYRVVEEPPRLGALSGTLRQLTQWCLEKAPEERPHVADLLRAFRELPDDGWQLPRVTPGELRVEMVPPAVQTRGRWRVWRPSRRALRLGAAAVATALVVGVGAYAVDERLGGEEGARGDDGGRKRHPDTPADLQPWHTSWSASDAAPKCLLDSAQVICARPRFGNVERYDLASGQEQGRLGDIGTTLEDFTLEPGVAVIHSRHAGQRVLRGYDTHTGDLLWTDRRTEPASPLGLQLSHGVLVHVQDGTDVVGRDAGTGQVRWRRPLPAGGTPENCDVRTARKSAVAICRVGGNSVIHDYGLKQGRRHVDWSDSRAAALIGAHGNSPLLAYVDGEGADAVVDEIAPLFGDRPDVFAETTRPTSPITTRGVVAGYAYFALGSDGYVYAVDLETGRSRWQTAPSIDVATAPVVSGNTVYVAAASGRVAALDRRTGKERWATASVPDVGQHQPRVGELQVLGDAVFVPCSGVIFTIDAAEARDA
ncbi:protein kinase domain-containing protein [Streptomyces aculeolatus]